MVSAPFPAVNVPELVASNVVTVINWHFEGFKIEPEDSVLLRRRLFVVLPGEQRVIELSFVGCYFVLVDFLG